MHNVFFKRGIGLFAGIPAIALFNIVLSTFSTDLFSQEKAPSRVLTFTEVWDSARKDSPAQRAALYEMKAADIARNRSQRHWYPRIYADARIYRTNDPAQIFMSNLEQRSIRQEDFVPDRLNNPASATFSRGAIGMDLPLYEGGSKEFSARALEKIAGAKKYERELTRVREYIGMAGAYGAILVSRRQGERLASLQDEIERLFSKYQVGLKSNPVGYSGLLAMRSLKKKIEMLRYDNDAAIASLRNYIEERAAITSPDWMVKDQTALEFSGQYLKAATDISKGRPSYLTKSFDELADSSKNQAKAEQARFLPKLGIFSEVGTFGGERDYTGSYNVGFYVQMNIFSATDYGALEEARLSSSAARARADDARLRQNSEISRLLDVGASLEKNITLMEESLELMEEQSINSGKLFANGAISAIQLTEVFAKKADLIAALSRAESEYLNTRAGLLYYTDSGIDGEENDDSK